MKILTKMAIILFSSIVALLILEVIIRVKEGIWPSSEIEISNYIKEVSDEVALKDIVQNSGISSKTYNIYYFGGSSMYGEPYLDTIPILVEKMLGKKVNNKEIKWINLAFSGANINEVNKRIKMVVDKKELYFPSLIVVYAGHNEFITYHNHIGFSFQKNDSNPIGWLVYRSRLMHKVAKILKLYKLEIDDRKFFDVPIVNEEKYKEIFENYKNKIQSTISYLEENNIPLIISTVAGNYIDFEPNRSVYTGDKNRQENFKKYMDLGKESYQKEKFEESLDYYQKALEIDGKFAEANYMMGQVYRKLGKNEEAWNYFSKAVDNDMMPIRAVSEQNDYILEIKESAGVGIVDAVKVLRENSKDGLIGNNYFTDAQHPNLKGYFFISELFAKKIADINKNTEYFSLPEEEAEKIFNTEEGLYNLYLSRAMAMLRYASWRYDPKQRLEMAENYLNRAISMRGNSSYSFLIKMTLSYLKKDNLAAEKFYKEAYAINAKETIKFLRDPWINQIIKRALN